MIHKKINITSVNKSLNNAKIDGKLKLYYVFLYRTISYYLDFTKDLTEKGFKGYENHITILEKLLLDLKYKYSSICNHKEKIDLVGNINPTPVNENSSFSGNTIYIN